MLYLIGGENQYLSLKRLEELKDEFVKKHQGEVHTYEADEIDNAQKILSEAESLSLFNKPQLTIIKRLFSATKDIRDKVTEYIKGGKNLNVILWEDKPLDKRLGLYKEVKKNGLVEEFKPLRHGQLKGWITKQLNGNIKFDPECIDALILKVGEDQSQLASILDNLITLKKASRDKRLRVEDIDNFVAKTAEESIWDFVDAISENDKKTALEIVEELIRDKSDFVKIIGMIARQLRILSLVLTLSQRGARAPQIARDLNLHPFVVRKAIGHSQNFSIEQLKKLYQKLVKTDLVVKQGKFEEKLALDLFIAAI